MYDRGVETIIRDFFQQSRQLPTKPLTFLTIMVLVYAHFDLKNSNRYRIIDSNSSYRKQVDVPSIISMIDGGKVSRILSTLKITLTVYSKLSSEVFPSRELYVIDR
jgi:hypothetical protein